MISASEVISLDNINPKFNFMNLYACTACNFDNKECGSQINMGEAYLFKDTSLGLNVAGGTRTLQTNAVDSAFYNDIASNISVGEAYKAALNRKSEDSYYLVLFGDPTIKYNLNKPSSATQFIYSNLAGRGYELATIEAGRAFDINTLPKEGENIEMKFIGIKPTTRTIKADNGRRVLLVPSDDDIGIQKIIAIVYTKDSSGNITNKYTETFNLNIVEESNNINGIYKAESSDNTIVNGSVNGDYVLFSNNNDSSIKFNNIQEGFTRLSYIIIHHQGCENKNATVKVYTTSVTSYPSSYEISFDSTGNAIVSAYTNIDIASIEIESKDEGLPDIDSIEIFSAPSNR